MEIQDINALEVVETLPDLERVMETVVKTKKAWEMTVKEYTKTIGNLYESPFKSLLNIGDTYKYRVVSKQYVNDGYKLFDAISNGDIKTVTELELKYHKRATAGDGWGAGPKQHPYRDPIPVLIGNQARVGRSLLQKHIGEVKQALSEGKPVPDYNLKESGLQKKAERR